LDVLSPSPNENEKLKFPNEKNVSYFFYF
jgi:hypothetical protein